MKNLKLSDEEQKRMLEGLERYRQDSLWIDKNWNELLKAYPEQTVAVYNKTVVDHDANWMQLMARMRKEGKHDPAVCVFHFITKNPPMLLF
jgi:hypothetical protein